MFSPSASLPPRQTSKAVRTTAVLLRSAPRERLTPQLLAVLSDVAQTLGPLAAEREGSPVRGPSQLTRGKENLPVFVPYVRLQNVTEDGRIYWLFITRLL